MAAAMCHTYLCLDKVAKYVTCDIDRNPNAEVIITPAGTVALSDASFDVVLYVQVLEQVDDVNKYLAEAYSLLEKDGLTPLYSWTVDLAPLP